MTLKRVIDVLGAAILLVVTAPIVLVCAIAIRLSSPGPALFRQTRAGILGTSFEMLKLRTMHEHADAILAAHLADSPELRQEWEAFRRLRDDPRRIPVLGKFLRGWSLDELPQ